MAATMSQDGMRFWVRLSPRISAKVGYEDMRHKACSRTGTCSSNLTRGITCGNKLAVEADLCQAADIGELVSNFIEPDGFNLYGTVG